MSSRCHLGVQRWATSSEQVQVAAAEGPAARSQKLPPASWESTRAVHLHTLHQGDNGQHTLRKEMASIHTKNSPHSKKILNPHKLLSLPHKPSKIVGEIKNFSDKQKLKEYSNTKPILKEILKALL